jgi:hypothetical protein
VLNIHGYLYDVIVLGFVGVFYRMDKLLQSMRRQAEDDMQRSTVQKNNNTAHKVNRGSSGVRSNATVWMKERGSVLWKETREAVTEV